MPGNNGRLVHVDLPCLPLPLFGLQSIKFRNASLLEAVTRKSFERCSNRNERVSSTLIDVLIDCEAPRQQAVWTAHRLIAMPTFDGFSYERTREAQLGHGAFGFVMRGINVAVSG